MSELLQAGGFMAKTKLINKQSHFTKIAGFTIRNRRKVKDVLFRSVFGNNKQALLELYNLLNDTDYTDSEKLEIMTIENAIIVTYENDVSFMFSGVISLYEHQSTINPNMPVRFLIYLSEEYQRILDMTKRSIYGSTLIQLPTPKFVVFYNGEKNLPDIKELQISDAYENKDVEPDLQLRVKVININYGHNRAIMEGCKTLEEYAHFVSILRENAQRYNELETAIIVTIDFCIEHNILMDFLRERKSEVVGMIMRDFDKKKYEYTLREEGRLEGRIEVLIAQIQDGEVTIESAAKRLDMTPEEFKKKYLEEISK